MTPQASGPRSIVKQIEIAAPPDVVWKALTDPDELVRWFALDARVTAGPGGSIWLSWGEPMVAESTIEIWSPGTHLRTIEKAPLGGGLEASAQEARQPAPAAAEGHTPRVVDYFLDTRGGRTVVRLVHSGFDAATDWDNELQGAVNRGWQFELRSLRHYVERHRGTPRSVVRVQRTFSTSDRDLWDRFMGSRGVMGADALRGASEGDQYSIRSVTGDAFNGIVQIYDPPRQFAATVANLNDALLRIELVKTKNGALEATLWLAAYGLPQASLKAFERRWATIVEHVSE